VFTRRAIDAVVDDLILGAILAVLVILLFLRNLRATFIASLALPTSVIATFGVIQALGFTMNNLTMLALSLSIGMLIDDAIVVLENIHRHLEMGKSPVEAARVGVGEIGLAVLATTLSIVAVFVPVAFMQGIIGRFFYEFGVTVAVAVMVSLFVSFTLTPMAAAKLLGHHKEGRLAAFIGRGLDVLDRGYRRAVGWTLRHRLVTVGVGVASLVFSLSLARDIPSAFRPQEDNGELDVPYSLPEGTAIDATFARGEEIARVAVATLPNDVRHVLLTVGAGSTGKVNEGSVFLKLTGSKERDRDQWALASDLRRAFAAAFPGADMGVTDAAVGGSASAAFMARPLNLALRGTDSRELRDAGLALIEALKKEPGFVDLSISDKGARPQFGFTPDRDKVSAAGLQPAQVAGAIRTAVNGTEVSEFREGADRYKVVVKAPERYRRDTAAVLSLPLRGPMGNLVEVGELVNPLPEDAPAQIDREDRIRQITILGSLEGIALGQAQDRAAVLAKEVLPPSVTLTFGGQGKVMKESFGYLTEALVLAIILIYMVLAAQFESFLHPLTIMVSLPLSLIGALGFLYLSGLTMSIMTFIGIIMLMGLVTKNAILLVDRANARRAEGDAVFDAMVEAGASRLRPILMTSAAMIFGMFPVVLALGEGSEGRVPMGVVVIGGLLTSTVLTLLVVPAVYSAFESGRVRLKRLFDAFASR
jgi:HAE1 family hydrophobic/amphiphilic exporter-1